ncbi:MAG TPA: hypothetical protein VI278_02160 [Nitrososphaeraceae archaeon]
MNHTTLIVTVMLAFSLFLFVVLTNPYSYAQQILSVSSTHPKTHAVRITSPNKGQQVPIGRDLSVSGISSTIGVGNATTTPSTCQAYVIVNSVKPYQLATGTGPGGAKDYSKWNFVLTSKYTTIKPGPSNKITAKYVCSSNPTSASFYSVNVTGVGANSHPELIASTHTPTSASPHEVLSAPNNTHSLSPSAAALKQKEQQSVYIKNTIHSNPVAAKRATNPLATPTSSINIGGFNSSAIIAGLKIPTSGTASAISYKQPIVPATTSNSSNIGGPISATSLITGVEPNAPASNIGSTTDHTSHGYESKDTTDHSSDSKDKSTQVSHHNDKTPRIHSSDVSYKHSSNSIPSGYNSQQVCSNYGSDTIVCSNGNSQNVEAGKYLDQPNHPQEASTNSRSISSDNSITAATGAIITLPARTIPSQSATITLTAQLNTPMTISIPGVGKVMATASPPIEGRTCPSISYQVNSDIGMLCLRIDWYTLS